MGVATILAEIRKKEQNKSDNDTGFTELKQAVTQLCDEFTKVCDELKRIKSLEPILYEVNYDDKNDGWYTFETVDKRNIGLAKVQSQDVLKTMEYITEKYLEAGFRVVFKAYVGCGDEWKSVFEEGEEE